MRHEDKSVDDALYQCWRLINLNCTPEQRDAFNEFRCLLFLRLDNLRDWIRLKASTSGSKIPKEIEQLLDMVCEIPLLEE